MEQFRQRRLQNYGQRVFGLRAYINFWSWLMFATLLALLGIKLLFFVDSYAFVVILSALIIALSLFAAVAIREYEKGPFIVNVISLVTYVLWIGADALLTIGIIVTRASQGVIVTDDAAYNLGVSIGQVIVILGSAWYLMPLFLLCAACFVVAIVTLVNFIRHREMFLAPLRGGSA